MLYNTTHKTVKMPKFNSIDDENIIELLFNFEKRLTALEKGMRVPRKKKITVPKKVKQKLKLPKKKKEITVLEIDKKILYLINYECEMNRSVKTEPISLQYLSMQLCESLPKIKESIQKLDSNGYLVPMPFSANPRKWREYQLTDYGHEQFLLNKN